MVALDQMLEALGEGRLVHLERLPARPARLATLSEPLPDDVARSFGVESLWSHQAEAIDLARSGRSVAIATGTASGKTLCYQLPVAEAVGGDEQATALLLYPTKALAQDQLRSLAEHDLPGLVATCFDGDSTNEERAWARKHASVVLTNPDMVHVGLLPQHERWATFLMRLRFVVVDELHTLRGIFGSHVAHLLRRLRRLCARYGSSPTFIFGSATIGEPASLASALCGIDVTAVTEDGSPRGERLFALWNPPLLDRHSGARASANVETASLLAELVEGQYRAIAFCRSRKGTELVAADTSRRVPSALAPSIRPYRGGYLARERREIEAELFSGRLRGVVATSALELGIDIGSLDACVLDGFPGTIASLWQQAGRAGRARQRSLAVLVAGPDQLDQWFMAHPGELFSRPPEPAVINPSNPFVLHPHLRCAAYELPLSPADEAWWGDDLDEGVRQLVLADGLKVRSRRAYPPTGEPPAWSVGLRSGSSTEYQIETADGRLVGTVDGSRAFEVVHPGAVYLHQGVVWRVDELDLTDRVARVSPAPGDEVTSPRSETSIRVLEEEARCVVGRLSLRLGTVEVSTQVVGYRRRDMATGARLGTVALDLPATCLVTRAFWYTVDPDELAGAGVGADRWAGTLHAVEHAAIGILPLFTICDRWDVGGVSTPLQVDTGKPTIVIYDGHPGGAGIAELGYAAGLRHLGATLEVLRACPCTTGCPSCVQSPKCGNGNEPLDKAGALSLLETALA